MAEGDKLSVAGAILTDDLRRQASPTPRADLTRHSLKTVRVVSSGYRIDPVDTRLHNHTYRCCCCLPTPLKVAGASAVESLCKPRPAGSDTSDLSEDSGGVSTVFVSPHCVPSPAGWLNRDGRRRECDWSSRVALPDVSSVWAVGPHIVAEGT